MPSFLRLVCRRNMTAAHYKGGHHPGNDLGLHYTALPPIAASCPYSDQLLVTRKFWSPGANRPSQAKRRSVQFRFRGDRNLAVIDGGRRLAAQPDTVIADDLDAHGWVLLIDPA